MSNDLEESVEINICAEVVIELYEIYPEGDNAKDMRQLRQQAEEAAIRQLASLPNVGEPRPHFGKGLRSILVPG